MFAFYFCVAGKTEVIKNNLNPKWVKVFILDYELGSTTKVAFSVFDEVLKGENKSMGSAVFDVAELLAARGSTKAKKLRGGGTYVFIFILWRRSIVDLAICLMSGLYPSELTQPHSQFRRLIVSARKSVGAGVLHLQLKGEKLKNMEGLLRYGRKQKMCQY